MPGTLLSSIITVIAKKKKNLCSQGNSPLAEEDNKQINR